MIFFFPLSYRLLGHAKINICKFMFYFSRNLRGKKRARMIELLYPEKKKLCNALSSVAYYKNELLSKIKKLVVQIS